MQFKEEEKTQKRGDITRKGITRRAYFSTGNYKVNAQHPPLKVPYVCSGIVFLYSTSLIGSVVAAQTRTHTHIYI
jgi:hypothetical protein